MQSKVNFQVTKVQQVKWILLLTKAHPSIQSKVKSQVKDVQQEIKVILLTNNVHNTEQGTISGDTSSTGNKGYIDAKGPSINTDQGKMSGDKVPTGNKGFIAN